MGKENLLGLRGCAASRITEILDTAAEKKRLLLEPVKRSDELRGKCILNLFYENSTRTRVSFELACKYLSAVTANITASGSSVAKGESLLDTARTLDVMAADVLVMRHPQSGAPHFMAQHVKAAVINAGDGTNEHPTQALLDMLTMREHLGGLRSLRVAICGDVLHSRVARSNVFGLTAMGASVVLAGPPTLLYPPGCELEGAEYTTDVRQAVRGADVVMGLRIQLERQKKGLFPSVREYSRFFGVDEEVLSLARPGALLMHPGPVNRGIELSSLVVDGEQSVIDEQVTNGVAVRMALLQMLTRGDAQ